MLRGRAYRLSVFRSTRRVALGGGTPGVLRGSGPKHVCWVLGSGYETTLVRGTQREGGKMTEQSRQPKDKNYNLIAVLYQSSDNVESLKTYIQDAQAEGDQELVDFFEGILENNLRAAQRAKEMLVPRFQSEQE
jgi:hypothetical protein